MYKITYQGDCKALQLIFIDFLCSMYTLRFFLIFHNFIQKFFIQCRAFFYGLIFLLDEAVYASS